MVITWFFTRLDWAWFHSINSIAGRNVFADWLGRVGADDHIVPVLLALLAIAALLFARGHDERNRAIRSILCAIGAAALSMALLHALNNLFFRPRPFTTRAVHVLFYHNTDSSFPSNAATLAFALAFGVFLYRRKIGAAMLALAAYQGFCRVFVGVHYPLDIVAGLVLGLGAALIVRAFDPAYAPLAGWLNSRWDSVLTSWKRPHAIEPARLPRRSEVRR